MVFLFLQAMTKEMFLEFLVATKISRQKRREKHLEVNMLLAIINAERIVTKNLVLSPAAVRVFTSIRVNSRYKFLPTPDATANE